MDLTETVTGTEPIFSGRIVKLRIDSVTLPNGATSKREVVEHHGAVCMVPMKDENTVLLVRQFRLPAGKVLLEIPAGGLEPDEEPMDCARRELAEEIRKKPAELIPLFTAYLAPGYSTELMYGYLALNLSDVEGVPDADEFVETVEMSLEDALAAIDSGEIQDSKTICGLTLAARRVSNK